MSQSTNINTADPKIAEKLAEKLNTERYHEEFQRIPIEKKVQYTENVPVTEKVPITKYQEVTKEVPVTKTREEIETLQVREKVPVVEHVQTTKTVDVTRNIPVTEQQTVVERVPIQQMIPTIEKVPVTREVVVGENVPITKFVPDPISQANLGPGIRPTSVFNRSDEFGGVLDCKYCKGDGFLMGKRHRKPCLHCFKITHNCPCCRNTGERLDKPGKFCLCENGLKKVL